MRLGFQAGLLLGIVVGASLAVSGFAVSRTLDDTLASEARSTASQPPTRLFRNLELETWATAATPSPVTVTSQSVEVMLGPGSGYAVLGVLTDRFVVDVLRVDATGAWSEIEFPPNSTGRGWIPSAVVTSLPAGGSPQQGALSIVSAPASRIEAAAASAMAPLPDSPGDLLRSAVEPSDSSALGWKLAAVAAAVAMGMPGLTALIAWLARV